MRWSPLSGGRSVLHLEPPDERSWGVRPRLEVWRLAGAGWGWGVVGRDGRVRPGTRTYRTVDEARRAAIAFALRAADEQARGHLRAALEEGELS